jgi:tetratricopeptide (TPR) repeat protein
VQNAGKELLPKLSKDPGNPQQFEFDLANSRRRQIIIDASARKFSSGETLTKLFDELREQADDFRVRRHYNSFVNNLDVISKLAFESGQIELAHQSSQEALEWAPRIDHWWALQEHYWREADYYRLKNDHEKCLENVSRAIRLYEKHPVVLEPVLVDDKPRPNDPLKNLPTRFGIRPEELAERGLHIVDQQPSVPLGLTGKRLQAVVNGILG